MTLPHFKFSLTVLALIGASLLSHAVTASAVQPAATLQQAPSLRLPDLAGVPRDLSQWRGRPVLLNYWATWCGPCLKELPELEAFSRTQAARPGGIQLVGVAQDDAQPAAALAKRLALSYPQLVEADGPPGSAAAFGNPDGTLPFSVLIDARGRVLKIHHGPLDASELARLSALVEASR
ncbi:TlpA disulfide reductase family protein [Pseudoxanthomonas sp.]|uniref:TlpA family protein disulfide reductase n=1 Tax=Pseudoxanthomonas sp. TaxID=1871049 RepID=UPI0026225E4B|nr:TlpA disulfide reductase family protein [Pseudoxanthomonas sp.]WDS37006.1 MAG: TlpA disulfide reductase family protein [Pseudoxanthomonas sp.]